VSYWFDNEVTSPSNGATIVDTGPLSAASRSVTIAIHSSLPGTFELQQVDDDNTTVLHRQKFSILSGQTDLSMAPDVKVQMETDQRLRIVSKQALTLGVVSGSIWCQ